MNGHCAPLNPPAGINGACSNNVDCSGCEPLSLFSFLSSKMLTSGLSKTDSITAGASTANCTDLTSAVGSGICGIVGSSTIPHSMFSFICSS